MVKSQMRLRQNHYPFSRSSCKFNPHLGDQMMMEKLLMDQANLQVGHFNRVSIEEGTEKVPSLFGQVGMVGATKTTATVMDTRPLSSR